MLCKWIIRSDQRLPISTIKDSKSKRETWKVEAENRVQGNRVSVDWRRTAKLIHTEKSKFLREQITRDGSNDGEIKHGSSREDMRLYNKLSKMKFITVSDNSSVS